MEQPQGPGRKVTRVVVTVEKFYGNSTIMQKVEIPCRDAQQVELVGNALVEDLAQKAEFLARR